MYLVFLDNLKHKPKQSKIKEERKYLELGNLFENYEELKNINKKLEQKKYIKSEGDSFNWLGSPFYSRAKGLLLVTLGLKLRDKYFRKEEKNCSDKQLWYAMTNYYNYETSYTILKNSNEGNTLKYRALIRVIRHYHKLLIISEFC